MKLTPMSRTVTEAGRGSTLNRPGAVVWLGVSAILLLALAQNAWAAAIAAASCLLLAVGPRVFTVFSGIAFPDGLSTGILAFNAAALLAGEIAGFYVTVWWWDMALHLVSSAVLSVVGMALAMMATGGAQPDTRGTQARVAIRMLAILAFGFSMMVGAAWELMEFSLDATLGTVTQRSGLADTMGDVALNLVGGLLGAVAAHAHVTRGKDWPPATLLGRFMDLNAALYPARRHARPARR